MGAALLFWGLQTGWIGASVAAALLAEGFRLSRFRWELGDADFARIWDFCAVVLLGAAVYFYSAEERVKAVFLFIQKWPLIFLPILLAQVYSASGSIRSSVFSWFLRRRRRAGLLERDPLVRIDGVYFAICLLAASATNRPGLLFYSGLSVLLVWTLWFLRPRKFSLATTGAAFVIAIAMGWIGQMKLREFQQVVESKVSDWVSRFARHDFDATESRTGIGHIGSKKTSGRILMRVRPSEGGSAPELLRQASYDTLNNRIWHVARQRFDPVPFDLGEMSWQLLPSGSYPKNLTVEAYFPGRRGLLSLPLGSAQVSDLLASEMDRSVLGAVRIKDGPPFASYRIQYDGARSFDEPPQTTDLLVPDAEEAGIQQFVDELKLEAARPAETMRKIEDFFATRFRYALFVPGNQARTLSGESALHTFLFETKAGHCEYFATATVLLLRSAGIPARYATGFAVQERKKDGTYFVRDRHAHAWTLVHYDGRWHDFDTTPASWFAEEEKRADLFEGLHDRWRSFQFSFSKWRWSGRENWFARYGQWLLLPLLGGLAWRLYGAKRRREKEIPDCDAANAGRPGADSELYQLEVALRRRGYQRAPGETLGEWLSRIELQPDVLLPRTALSRAVALHYRYRFSVAGIEPAARQELRSCVALLDEACRIRQGTAASVNRGVDRAVGGGGRRRRDVAGRS